MSGKFTAHFPPLDKERMGVIFRFTYSLHIFYEAQSEDQLSMLVSAFGLSSIALKETLFLFLFLLTFT